LQLILQKLHLTEKLLTSLVYNTLTTNYLKFNIAYFLYSIS